MSSVVVLFVVHKQSFRHVDPVHTTTKGREKQLEIIGLRHEIPVGIGVFFRPIYGDDRHPGASKLHERASTGGCDQSCLHVFN